MNQTSQQSYPYLAGLAMDLRKFLRSLGPSDEVCRHLTNAQVEVLRAMRQAIDERIQKLETQCQTGTRVEVE